MLSNRIVIAGPLKIRHQVATSFTSAFDPDLPSYDGPAVGRWLHFGFGSSARPGRERDGKSSAARLVPGLHKLNLRDWIIMDPARVADELALKRMVFNGGGRESFLQAHDRTTYVAQQELQELLISHLLRRYPSYYTNLGPHAVRLQTEHMANGFTVDATEFETPLEFLCSLIQEDVVLMRRDDDSDSYRMVAACVCFSFGDLVKRVAEQRDMEAIHRNVHGFKEDLQRPVDRVMKSLKVDAPVWRVNWSLPWASDLLVTSSRYPTGDVESGTSNKAATQDADLVKRLEEEGVGQNICLKAEYQTLRRLPVNTDFIVFTVRTFLEPLCSIEQQPTVAAALATNIRSIAQIEFAKYKGLENTELRERILHYLDSIVTTN